MKMKINSIKTKLLTIGIIPIILFIFLIIFYLVPTLENVVFQEKEIQTREMVNIALGIVQELHQKEKQGELTK